MDSSFFFTILAAVIGFYVLFRKFRSHQEERETDSPSSSLLPSSLSTPSDPPASSSHNWTYEVFPSFRGEDVRQDFLSHIQKEFQRKGITLFIDNKIKRAESIGPELIRAIRGSKIAIILLSRNYASSKWCLDELVEIMKCREELGQTVMAIFYKVDPSDVKKLAGDFGKIFKNTCKGRTKEETSRWRHALETVATIAGYHSNNWDNEAAMIENIAMDVSNKLINSTSSSDFDGFVGMRAHMEKMESILGLESDKVRMIGIWGPSGIGKSTIARVLLERYSGEFQLSVFMENIKRRYPSPYYDEYSAKLQLQKDFLSQIINHDVIMIHHLGVAQERLKDKKVLVVVDDIDHLAQLDAIARETRWFGPGSRIIITTQDKRILNAHGISHIYEVDFPRDYEAVQMFCMYAFGQNFPHDGFEELAWEITLLAGKLPLGLRVMGCYFKGMSKDEWIKALPRLRISLDGEIESILKFSYDALRCKDKELFLYIACFFNNERIEKVAEHLRENFINVRKGLHVLAEKSLISFSWGRIRMHDLLTRLGKEIVCKHKPRQRQFLFDTGDICQVLDNDTLGSRSVTCIDFTYPEIEDDLFERTLNLQFFRARRNHNIPPRVITLPRKLRLLHWVFFPLASLPCNFNPEFLVELKMPSSKLEKLWEGIQTIKNLKWVDLDDSGNLKELPDLSTAISLEEVNLRGCSSLRELPSSIGNAINLRKLDLGNCLKLVELPSSVGNATNLRKLNLRDCSKLLEIPSSIGRLINLRTLDLCGCSNLVELPASIGNLARLHRLYLDGCSSLVKLPSSFGNLISLHKLNLRDCSSLVKLPSSVGNLISLVELNLKDCSNLVKLPSSIRNLTNLTELQFGGCSSLVELPSSIGNLINIEYLHLRDCSSLVELPLSIGNLINLKKLELCRCSSLVTLPSSIGNLKDLWNLDLNDCSKLESVSVDINMESLDVLDLTCCSSLKDFPEISTNIRVLSLIGTAIEEVPSSIRSWSRLDELHMSYSNNLGKFPHAFDYITELHVSDTRIQEMAPWVKELSGLESLVVRGCTELVSLTQLPESLSIIDAENCESLERLDCSFNDTEFVRLYFVNCFKLNQEARDFIIKTPTCKEALVPGQKVPSYFTYRANGRFLSMKLNGFNTHLPVSLKLKACVLPIIKGTLKVEDQEITGISYCITEKHNGVIVTSRSNDIYLIRQSLMEHLHIFEFDEEVSSSELVFEFEFDCKSLEIGECGMNFVCLGPSC